MTDRKSLGTQELKAIVYFAVGVSTEGSLAGRDVSNHLSFAGTWPQGGLMHPVESSGISIGTLQKDLGQDNGVTATALMEAYQHWAAKDAGRLVLSDRELTNVIIDLSRNGPATRAGVQQALARGEAAIGVAEAAYRQPTEAMATYQTLEPTPVPAASLATPVAEPVARDHAPEPAGVDSPTAQAIRRLQQDLNTLGIPDADGRPLATHGSFDMATRAAVARFQSSHGMPVTGQADESTHEAVRTEAFIAGLPSVAPEPTPVALAHAPAEPWQVTSGLLERPPIGLHTGSHRRWRRTHASGTIPATGTTPKTTSTKP